MIRKTLAALALICVQSTTAEAIQVNPGDTIRGAYSFATTGTPELEPVAFFLRLTSSDLFGGGDSIGIRYLDAALDPLSFTRFDASGSGLDPTVGITFDVADFLPGASPNVPQSGFIEIVGLAGSFDVLSLNLTAVEQLSAIGILRQSLVSDFEYVAAPTAAVPLPASLVYLISVVLGLFGIKIARHNGIASRRTNIGWRLSHP